MSNSRIFCAFFLFSFALLGLFTISFTVRIRDWNEPESLITLAILIACTGVGIFGDRKS